MLTSFFLPTIGGVENHVYNLCKALQKKGHHVVVVHTCFDIQPQDGKNIHVENVEGIETHRLYLGVTQAGVHWGKMPVLESYVNGFLRKARPIVYSKRIAAYIKKIDQEHHFDLIHQHDFISNLFTTKILSKSIPLVLTNHTGEYLLLNKHLYTSWLLPWLLSHVSYMMGPSHELCDAPFLAKQGKVAYIANGVNLTEFKALDAEKKNDLRKALSIDPDFDIVLCARRWAPTKGVLYLVQAIKTVMEKCPKVHFLISGNDYYGYPAYRNLILGTIEKEKLQDYITLLGDIPHDQIGKYYQIADIIALPSLMEATSLSGLEAMACGKPLLGTDVGGIPEIIDNGVTGYLVPAKDPAALAKAIIAMLSDKERLARMGQKARMKAEKEFSWDVVAMKNEKVYESVLSQRADTMKQGTPSEMSPGGAHEYIALAVYPPYIPADITYIADRRCA